MLLTQSTTPIIGWIATLLGYIMQGIFSVLSAMGIENIGLCIIIFTFIVRIFMLPMTISQQKSSKLNQAMQPEINKIQKKYRNKKDQASMQRQQKEIQEVYDKYGFSPTGGCLQLIVQMPIFLALYQVIRNIPAYIPQVKASYLQIYHAIEGQSGYISSVKKIAETLKSSEVNRMLSGELKTPEQVIDVLRFFKEGTWNQLADAFPNAADTIHAAANKIVSMNDFILNINVSETPGFRFSIYLLIPLAAGLFQYLSFRTMQQPSQNGNDTAATMNKSMSFMMPLMSMYFCIIMPAGLGIYWIASALFQWVQQLMINQYMKNVDMDELIAQNREKAERKRAKGKKSLMERMAGASTDDDAKQYSQSSSASRGSNTISSIAAINAKKIPSKDDYRRDAQGNLVDVDFESMGEIEKKAYLVSRYNEDSKTRGGKK